MSSATERQRYVLSQIFNKMKKKPVSKWYDVVKAVVPDITTDLTEDKIFEYMKDVIFIGTTEINQCRIPVDGSFSDDDTADGKVLMINLDYNKEALKDFIFEKEEKKTETPSPATPSPK